MALLLLSCIHLELKLSRHLKRASGSSVSLYEPEAASEAAIIDIASRDALRLDYSHCFKPIL
jgi:hypothetical protein